MKLAMISKFSLVLAIASIAFTSCKKDKSGPDNPPVQTKKLTRVEENGQTTATIEYNTDGTVKKFFTDFGIFGAVTFTFTYNAQKKVSEITSSEGFRSVFRYENGKLAWAENYEDGEKVGENNFQYENGRVKSNMYLTAYPQGGGHVIYRPTFQAVYNYNANGTLQKISNFVKADAGDQLVLDNEYVYQQYDTKKNPLTVISEFSQIMMYLPVSENNPLIEKFYNANGSVEETTENVYTYDAAGYPLTLKSTATTPGQTPSVRNVKFIY
jgi:antitoxin component YwqK of YwqJK toxin-antitoxin module